MLQRDPGRKAHREFDGSGRFYARLQLAPRYCVAAVLGIALVVGSIVVWAVASVALAVLGRLPSKRPAPQRGLPLRGRFVKGMPE
jgi:hypothetical protein